MAERTTYKKIILFVIILFLVRCANQLPPKGGEVDRTPPEIVETDPENGTTSYNRNSFEITFSEYVNKRSVQESIFISPNIEGEIEYDWSGTSLEVELPDSLLDNTTYTITIGTDVEDINNNNKMARSYTFAFSTGDKIDKGRISGNIIDKSPAGVMIYAYKLNADTLNPAKQKPNYISQTGEKGSFELTGLADGNYRVFAMRDEFRDFLYNPTQDQFGVPYSDFRLDSLNQAHTELNYFMQIADTSQPRVYNATMTDKHHILIEFSEPVDSSQITNENFYLYDSLNNEKTNVTYFYKGKTKKKNFLIAFADTVKSNESVQLVAQNIIDLKGNITQLEKTAVVVNEKPDTTHPVNSGFITQYFDKKSDYIDGWVKLLYDDAVDISLVDQAVEVIDKNGQTVPFNVQKIDDASFRLVFDKLKTFSEYKVLVDQNYFEDVAGNKIDSTFTYEFGTINNLEFSGVSGEVIKQDKKGQVIVLLENYSDESIKQQQTLNGTEFNFNRVIPGNYFLWVFIDNEGNNEYDKGNIYPYKPADRFIIYGDTLNLRPRWPVGDIKMNFDK